jgi:hypothetical protein
MSLFYPRNTKHVRIAVDVSEAMLLHIASDL